ncbi:MAG TPA: preprotein translocase subunit YajC [Acidimicrobiales bacterium]|nr:preprotein translocase subunit YajC [Acidimicrobiales bacterium]
MNLALISAPHEIAGMALAVTSKSKSGGSSTLLLFVLLFAAMYFLWLRPQRKKMQQRQLDQVRSIDVGDEVVTQSGIIGTVVGLDDDRAEIQVSTGVVLTVVRAAIGRRVEPVVPESPSGDDDMHDSNEQFGDSQLPPQKGKLWKRRGRGEDA